MGKLADALNQAVSNDVITPNFEVYNARERERELEEKKARHSGPVKEKIDLSLFECFNITTCHMYRTRHGLWITVSKNGEVRISHEIGKHYEVGATVELLLNRAGTILVMRESRNGFALKASESDNKKSLSKRFNCKDISTALEKKGIQLPVRFVVNWDDDLKAWVGRLK